MSRRYVSPLVPGESQRDRNLRLMRERAAKHRAARPPVQPQSKTGAKVRRGPALVDAAHVRAAAKWALW